MGVTLDARTEVLTSLLSEYSQKLTELNRELHKVVSGGRANAENPGLLAWLLDRAQRFGKPIQDLVNQAAHSTFVNDISEANSIEAIELALRLGETEAQLHHMLRQADELEQLVRTLKIGDQVARLRESAGLNAMKGGPLRPKS